MKDQNMNLCQHKINVLGEAQPNTKIVAVKS